MQSQRYSTPIAWDVDGVVMRDPANFQGVFACFVEAPMFQCLVDGLDGFFVAVVFRERCKLLDSIIKP